MIGDFVYGLYHGALVFCGVVAWGLMFAGYIERHAAPYVNLAYVVLPEDAQSWPPLWCEVISGHKLFVYPAQSEDASQCLMRRSRHKRDAYAI